MGGLGDYEWEGEYMSEERMEQIESNFRRSKYYRMNYSNSIEPFKKFDTEEMKEYGNFPYKVGYGLQVKHCDESYRDGIVFITCLESMCLENMCRNEKNQKRSREWVFTKPFAPIYECELKPTTKSKTLKHFEKIHKTFDDYMKNEDLTALIASRKQFFVKRIIEELKACRKGGIGAGKYHEIMSLLPSDDLLAPKTGLYIVQGIYGSEKTRQVGGIYGSPYQAIKVDGRLTEQSFKSLIEGLRPEGFGEIEKQIINDKSKSLPLTEYNVFEVPPAGQEFIKDNMRYNLDLGIKQTDF